MDRSRRSGSSPRQDQVVERPPRTQRPERPVQPTVPEIGGPKGPEPTRYGDWEKGGRCTDF
jgi:hypothetical protein